MQQTTQPTLKTILNGNELLITLSDADINHSLRSLITIEQAELMSQRVNN